MKKNFNQKNDKGQLLLLAGVIITILIVVSSILSVNLSISNRPSDEKTFIRSEFVNIREKFGFALNDKLNNDLMQHEDVVNAVFNETIKQFRFSLARYDYYFNAELYEIKFVDGQNEGLTVNLTMSNKHDTISEQIYYNIY